MSSKNIVGLCAGNIQRSATFDAVINYELEYQRITDLNVSSAGINVEKILTNETPLDTQVNMLKAGLHYGLVRYEIKREVEKVVSNGLEQEHTDNIKALYGEIRPLVHGYNLQFRNQALAEAGITNFPPPYTPLNPAKDFKLVLPMVGKHIPKIEARYNEKGITKPVIMTYGSLVGIDDLADNLQGGLAGAQVNVKYFMDTRKRAVEKMQELVYR